MQKIYFLDITNVVNTLNNNGCLFYHMQLFLPVFYVGNLIFFCLGRLIVFKKKTYFLKLYLNIGPDRLELIIFVIINKKIDNHPSRLITAESIMHYRFSSALYWQPFLECTFPPNISQKCQKAPFLDIYFPEMVIMSIMFPMIVDKKSIM